MAYNNSGCNTCNQAVPPACVAAPPVCAGSQCEEIYPGACVVYTGPAIECLGITTGMSLNDVVQILAAELCPEGCCENPVEWLLQYALDIYNIQLAKEESPSILTIMDELLKRGIVMTKCNVCCPDKIAYILGNEDDVETLVTMYQLSLASGSPNAAPGFADCLASLAITNPLFATRFDSVLTPVTTGTEWGTISGNTTLCIFNTLYNIPQFDSTTLYSLMDAMLNVGVIVNCEDDFLSISTIAHILPN